ncbi:unnamed protein product, partial [Effrenium voratum]
ASAGCGRFEVEPAQLGFPERPRRDHHGLPGRRACGHRPRQCARHHGGADFAHGGAGEAALESHGHHGLAPLRGPPFPALRACPLLLDPTAGPVPVPELVFPWNCGTWPGRASARSIRDGTRRRAGLRARALRVGLRGESVVSE